MDLTAGTVTISGKVKNKPSVRKIPVAQRIVEILKAAKDGDIEKPVGCNRMDNYSAAIRRQMKRWGHSIPPMNLRKTVPTTAEISGWDNSYVDRYLGHGGESTKRRHYQKPGKALIDVPRD